MEAKLRKRWALFISKGYFPEELPPFFTTEDLFDIIMDPSFQLNKYKYEDDEGYSIASKLLSFSIPRVKVYRRLLGIPGPLHYTRLTHMLVTNSEDISATLKQSKISVFKDYVSSKDSRYIAKPDFTTFIEQRILRSPGYRYLLSVDITRFYSSIYTHSIAWALHGKGVAKKSIKHNLIGNKIDRLCRDCQDRQAMGIPIGPDSSRIISEIILSAVDRILQEELESIDFTGIRNVDDYFLYFQSLADLEKGRTKLQQILREFELELNFNKERVIDLPEIVENEWRAAIRAFRFRSQKKFERADLIAFFDLSFSMARKFPEEIVITYAVAKIRGHKISMDNWELLQACLLNCLVLESKVVEQVVHELLFYVQKHKYKLNQKRIKAAFESFLLYHSQHDHHFEIIWSLWFYSRKELSLSKTVTEELSKSSNDLVILMLLQLSKQNLLKGTLPFSQWGKYLTLDNLTSEHWLLAYEGILSGFLDGNSEYIDKIPFFKLLKEKGVRFFKTDRSMIEEHFKIETSGSSLSRELKGKGRKKIEIDDQVDKMDFEEND